MRKTGPVRFAAFDLDGNGRGRLEGGQSGQSLIDAHFEVWSLGSACAWWMLWPAGNLLSSGPCRDQHPPIGEIVGLGAAARFNHPGSASRLAGSHLFLVLRAIRCLFTDLACVQPLQYLKTCTYLCTRFVFSMSWHVGPVLPLGVLRTRTVAIRRLGQRVQRLCQRAPASKRKRGCVLVLGDRPANSFETLEQFPVEP